MFSSAPRAAAGDQWRINFSRVQWNVTWDDQLQTYVKVRCCHQRYVIHAQRVSVPRRSSSISSSVHRKLDT
jgi:hypothetical protein